jgi:hypothetical protein
MAQRSIGLVTGHHQYGVHALLEADQPRYFTILRDPIDRAVSNYFYAYQYDGHLQGEAVRSGELSLDAFISNSSIMVPHAQAHMLSGLPSFGRGHADRARENLANHFVATGVTEQFNATVLHIAKSLGWSPPFYLTRNVTKIDPAKAAYHREAVESAKEKYRDLYAEDYSVYDLAKQLLEERTVSEGRKFSVALDGFEEIQKDLSERDSPSAFLPYNFEDSYPLPDMERYKGSEPYNAVIEYLQKTTE